MRPWESVRAGQTGRAAGGASSWDWVRCSFPGGNDTLLMVGLPMGAWQPSSPNSVRWQDPGRDGGPMSTDCSAPSGARSASSAASTSANAGGALLSLAAHALAHADRASACSALSAPCLRRSWVLSTWHQGREGVETLSPTGPGAIAPTGQRALGSQACHDTFLRGQGKSGQASDRKTQQLSRR